jgi:hypothetical protein
VPHFNLPAYADGKVPAARRESEGRNFLAQGEVVETDPAGHVCEDRVTIFVYREQEVPSGI